MTRKKPDIQKRLADEIAKSSAPPEHDSGRPDAAAKPEQVVSPSEGGKAGNDPGDAQEVRTNDFDGDGKPGGSLGDLAWQLAEVGYAACEAWSGVRLDGVPPWSKLNRADRLLYAKEADRCINERWYVPTVFPNEGWESSVRNTLFAAVVRSIAL